MPNHHKIITMTKLALYDKNNGAADRAANEYFRHDYIYKKNLGTRLAVIVGGILLLAIHWTRLIFVNGVDVFDLDIITVMRDSVLVLLVIVAFYSFVGTIQGTREYHLIQKRLQKYQEMLQLLENEGTPPVVNEAEDNERRELEARERERQERRERRQRREQELNAARNARNARSYDDPLANVSARALSSTNRPRTVIRSSRDANAPSRDSTIPPVRPRNLNNPNDKPLR